MQRAYTRQGLLFQRYKHKLTRRINAENVVRQIRGAKASSLKEKTIISFKLSIQTLIWNKNSF